MSTFVPRLLVGAPQQSNDELLTSFLCRVCSNHHTSPHTFCNFVWPKHHFWTRDLDRSASDTLLREIAEKLGKSYKEIRELTVIPILEGLGEKTHPNKFQRWILPVGIYHRLRRRHGQLYCAGCLAEHPAYLRIAWRLSISVFCGKHQQWLRDSCPWCDAPIIPFRDDSLASRSCFACRRSLLTSSSEVTSSEFQQFQTSLYEHFGLLGGEPQPHSIDYLSGLYSLATFIARRHPDFSKTKGSWHFWRVAERRRLWEEIERQTRNWPNNFIAWAIAHNVSRNLVEEYPTTSHWLRSATVQLKFNAMRKRKKRKKSFLPKNCGNTVHYRATRASLLTAAAFERVAQRQCPLNNFTAPHGPTQT